MSVGAESSCHCGAPSAGINGKGSLAGGATRAGEDRSGGYSYTGGTGTGEGTGLCDIGLGAPSSSTAVLGGADAEAADSGCSGGKATSCRKRATRASLGSTAKESK